MQDNRDDCLRLAYQLDPSISRAAFQRVVCILGPRLAESGCAQATGIDPVALYEGILDGRGPSFRKIEVVWIGTDSIGVSVYLKLPVRVASQHLGYFFECRF